MQLENVLNSLYQKQPFRNIFRKMCSENMHAANFIYRTLMLKCNLLKPHLGMGVLLWICCIFLKYPFPRTPLDHCFCCIPTLSNKSFILFESKLNLIDNCWSFAKYVLFVFCFLQYKPSMYYFHQCFVFSYSKYLTAMYWFLVGHM